MTTTAVSPARATDLSFVGLLNSEWIKLRSLRSTVWCFAIMVVIYIGLGLVLALNASGRSGSHAQQQSFFVMAATLGTGVNQLVAAVLGALVITGEYSTGMIRATFNAAPKRLSAISAKLLVFAACTFVVGLVSILITALIITPTLSGHGIHADFGDGNVWLAFLGAAFYLALIGVFSLALGTIIRNGAGAISASIGVIFVLPVVLQIIYSVTGAAWPRNVDAFLPSATGAQLYAYIASSDGLGSKIAGDIALEPWQALLVTLGWVIIPLAIASVFVKRRDA